MSELAVENYQRKKSSKALFGAKALEKLNVKYLI